MNQKAQMWKYHGLFYRTMYHKTVDAWLIVNCASNVNVKSLNGASHLVRGSKYLQILVLHFKIHCKLPKI